MGGCTLGGPVCGIGSSTGGPSLPCGSLPWLLESLYPVNQIGVAIIIICIISKNKKAEYAEYV